MRLFSKRNKSSEKKQEPQDKTLTALEFNKVYYEEHKQAGLDYLGHGFWQESYGNMVAEATLQGTYEDAAILDMGCACGSILMGFKKTGIFARSYGVDVNCHMIELGKEHFGFSGDELLCRSADDTGLEDESITLAHSAQVFEHIEVRYIPQIVSEMHRVLRPGGRAFISLDAIRHGETAELYMGDPTHCNLQETDYWSNLFVTAGFLFDIESYDRYARSPLGPTEGDPASFFKAYNWSTWVLRKP